MSDSDPPSDVMSEAASEIPQHIRPASLARPYTWTEGRTRPTVELAIEALVQTTAQGSAVPYSSTSPASVVIQLCLQPRSVAEIAALLSVPLGVARVLVSDLLDARLVHLHDTLSEHATWEQRRELLARVLGGLRKL